MPTTSEQSEVRQAETVPAPGGVSLQYGPKGEPIAVVSPEAADEIGRREAVAKFRALMMKKLPQLAGAIETQRIDTFPIDEEIGRYIPGKYLFIMRSMDERKSPTWFDETGKMQLDFYEKMSRPAVRLFFMNPNKPMYAQEGSGYKIVLN
ncbi:MAG TPA: hypothetical protein PK765_06015 [bacterium]|nr:hypothetical protein [bacterium]